MLKILSIILLFCSSTSFSSEDIKIDECLSTREFVTTVGYLNDHKQFNLKEVDLLKIADSVSSGCTGAAGRFIKVSKMLFSSGIDTATSLNIAKRFAVKDAKYTTSFISLFKKAYLKEYLDLSVSDSLKLAMKLTIDLDGGVETVMADFGHLSLFCMQRELNLPYQVCSEMAGRISLYGAKFKKQIGKGFTGLYYFLVDSDGPGLPTFKALKLAENAMKNGPSAFNNFKKAYKYAVSGDSPARVSKGPLLFAMQMAKLSSKIH